MMLTLSFAALAAGCASQEPAAGDGRLTLGYVRWEESVAVANLTKVILEDELGYEKVTLRRGEPEKVLRDVASGELAAFQDVWMPTHEEMLDDVGGEVELLDTWLLGTTRSSVAVPSYVEAKSVSGLEAAGVEEVLLLRPGAAAVSAVPRGTVGGREVFFSSTSEMMEEVDRLYEAGEPFAFVAFSPHWMNFEYDLEYLVDPGGRLGELTQPAEPLTVVREGLEEEEPLAHRLMQALTLSEYQVSSLELEIRDARTPVEGARTWADDHQTLIRSWVRKVESNARGI